ncbi:MAG: hypothetical protein CO108_10310 [Deltaproteobacteria bacterium CG_4_9_14_3_um_filter_63_12]|nr:MAG: hypothetical protein COW42_02850 [Deltaproteobacteria bacterium CG17_big_fil_post_rev_8_21_14_2_50_63_7]PJB43250.1 MAG: hypothetical protein CO108_10310 [Deltaproteobacteria bacterium CG_4_9_14_3_um_filter_63_12]
MKPLMLLLPFLLLLTFWPFQSGCFQCLELDNAAVCVRFVDANGAGVTPDWVRYREGAGAEIGVDPWEPVTCVGEEPGVIHVWAGLNGEQVETEVEVQGEPRDMVCYSVATESVTVQFPGQ